MQAESIGKVAALRQPSIISLLLLMLLLKRVYVSLYRHSAASEEVPFVYLTTVGLLYLQRVTIASAKLGNY